MKRQLSLSQFVQVEKRPACHPEPSLRWVFFLLVGPRLIVNIYSSSESDCEDHEINPSELHVVDRYVLGHLVAVLSK